MRTSEVPKADDSTRKEGDGVEEERLVLCSPFSFSRSNSSYDQCLHHSGLVALQDLRRGDLVHATLDRGSKKLCKRECAPILQISSSLNLPVGLRSSPNCAADSISALLQGKASSVGLLEIWTSQGPSLVPSPCQASRGALQ